MRHEDVDQHHVKRLRFERSKSGFATIGERDVEALTLEEDLDGRTDHRIVVYHEDTRHHMSQQIEVPTAIGDIGESCTGSILDWTWIDMHGAMHSWIAELPEHDKTNGRRR